VRRFITAFLCCSCLSLLAQPDYQLQLSQAPYQELSGGALAYDGSSWGGYMPYTINLGFPFTFMDTTVTAVTLEATGRLVFDVNHNYWLDMTTVANFQSKAAPDYSPITIHRKSLADQSQVLIIQYKEAVYQQDTSLSINFQLRLYQRDNAIEMHMGPRDDVQGSNAIFLGPYLGYYHSPNPSQANFTYGRNWTGKLDDKTDTVFSGSNTGFLNFTLDDLTATDQVVRLKPLSTVGVNLQHNKKPQIYFNPATAKLSLESYSGPVLRLEITNTSGKTVYRKEVGQVTDLSFLKPGYYNLQLFQHHSLINSKKIIVP